MSRELAAVRLIYDCFIAGNHEGVTMGLLLHPAHTWDGDPKLEFKTFEGSDTIFEYDPVKRKAIRNASKFFYRASILQCSTISITEDGLIASKSNALAMIYIKHQLMLTDLKVNLPVILKVDLREYSILWNFTVWTVVQAICTQRMYTQGKYGDKAALFARPEVTMHHCCR